MKVDFFDFVYLNTNKEKTIIEKRFLKQKCWTTEKYDKHVKPSIVSQDSLFKSRIFSKGQAPSFSEELATP